MDNSARDQEIATLYAGGPDKPGLPATKLANKFGLSIPQVRRILSNLDAKRSPDAPKPTAEDKVVDPMHLKLGNRLYAYRFQLLNDTSQAAEAMGWSVKKLRGVEQGVSEISLNDLQDMAEYMKSSISELTRNL